MICSKAIDVYGGYGYCQEYPVEQYMRDCKIACLYEGTNGIQALDLVGRKLGQKKGMNVMTMFGEIGATVAKAKGIDELKVYAVRLEEAYNALVDMTMTLAQLGKSSSFLIPILNASPYLDIFGDVLVGHFLLQSAALCHGKTEGDLSGEGGGGIQGEKAGADS